MAERIVGKSGCTVAEARAKFSTDHYSRIRHEAEMTLLRDTLARVTRPTPPAPAPPAPEPDPPVSRDWRCTTCEQTGRRGYCAPTRCYCGHPTCHAYASWINLHPNREEKPS